MCTFYMSQTLNIHGIQNQWLQFTQSQVEKPKSINLISLKLYLFRALTDTSIASKFTLRILF